MNFMAVYSFIACKEIITIVHVATELVAYYLFTAIAVVIDSRNILDYLAILVMTHDNLLCHSDLFLPPP